MGDLFLKTLNMSIAASWLILAVVLLRFVLKKAPKWVNVLLWGIVAIRLICPVTIESPASMIPDSVGSGELISEWTNDYIGNVDIHHPNSVHYDAAIGAGREPISDGEGGYYVVTRHDQLGEPATIKNTVVPVLSVMWVAGMTVMAFYAVISFWHLRRKVNEAVMFKGNILLCDHVKSPFILGLVRPKIYLPSNIDATAMEPVIAHEKAHLARHDHWWKPLGFLILTVHWFNPLCWIAYVLLCRDIELACDEKVIRQMDVVGKKQYSTALLECNTQRRLVTICPLAFGEVGIKERVKNVLNYKKPAFWVIVVAVVAYAVVTVCFATNPVTEEPSTPNAERPTLIVDGNVYVNPYMPVSYLPYGYQSAGKLTGEQANNTGLEGIEYFIHPSKAEDFYTYQECGTPISIDTVDSTKRQWAYVRWIQDGNNAVDGRKLTLDDVVMLSQKGDALSWSDFERYQGREVGFGLYIMRYEIDELFDVLVGGVPKETPMYIYLRVNSEAEDHIDIRAENVSTFVEAHRNDVPKVIEPKPDGGGKPAPEEPDFSTLSEEQTAIHRAILEHNKSSYPLEYDVACCSFITLETLSATPLAGSSTHKITYYGWALYNEYRVTDNGLKIVSGGHVPVALSFDLDERGYTLTEYWVPRDGSYYAQDIREKFPAHIVEDGMDSQKFILQQTQECYAQAVASTGLDTEKVIGSLIETICSGPVLSSNPGDYIEAHPIEYRELTYYGRYTLKYCFTEFLKGGQTDLRGHIMRAAIDDIAPEAQLKLYAETGQEYFDAWKDAAMSVKEQHGMEWIEAHQPAIYLLLSMLGEA